MNSPWTTVESTSKQTASWAPKLAQRVMTSDLLLGRLRGKFRKVGSAELGMIRVYYTNKKLNVFQNQVEMC